MSHLRAVKPVIDMKQFQREFNQAKLYKKNIKKHNFDTHVLNKYGSSRMISPD